jgi:DNA relaxase NicK
MDNKINSAGLILLDYDDRWNRYKIRLTKNDIKNNKEILLEILKLGYER